MMCDAITKTGVQCKNRRSANGGTHCHVHALPAQAQQSGRLYVLSNPRINGLKIGWTTGRASDRASALTTTGVPVPFVVAYETDVVENAAKCEKRVFEALAPARVAANREFFETTLDAAKLAITTATSNSKGLRAEPALVNTTQINVEDTIDEVTLRFGETVCVTVRRPTRVNAESPAEH
ncbi:MAG: GIY-YIG nuclease family protein [Gammaproteobacteria bacterium]